jgi:hypothetical protein
MSWLRLQRVVSSMWGWFCGRPFKGLGGSDRKPSDRLQLVGSNPSERCSPVDLSEGLFLDYNLGFGV